MLKILSDWIGQIPQRDFGLDIYFVCLQECMQMKWLEAQGDVASRLRQRKFALLRTLRIPPDALPGSLSLTHRRCGKPTCHCAQGEGHPLWLLTFMVAGKRRVEPIPQEWVEQIQPLVEQGRQLKDAVAEVLATNAQLLTLYRKQSSPNKRPKSR